MFPGCWSCGTRSSMAVVQHSRTHLIRCCPLTARGRWGDLDLSADGLRDMLWFWRRQQGCKPVPVVYLDHQKAFAGTAEVFGHATNLGVDRDFLFADLRLSPDTYRQIERGNLTCLSIGWRRDDRHKIITLHHVALGTEADEPACRVLPTLQRVLALQNEIRRAYA